LPLQMTALVGSLRAAVLRVQIDDPLRAEAAQRVRQVFADKPAGVPGLPVSQLVRLCLPLRGRPSD
jgi:hypothetical protein